MQPSTAPWGRPGAVAGIRSETRDSHSVPTLPANQENGDDHLVGTIPPIPLSGFMTYRATSSLCTHHWGVCGRDRVTSCLYLINDQRSHSSLQELLRSTGWSGNPRFARSTRGRNQPNEENPYETLLVKGLEGCLITWVHKVPH